MYLKDSDIILNCLEINSLSPSQLSNLQFVNSPRMNDRNYSSTVTSLTVLIMVEGSYDQ